MSRSVYRVRKRGGCRRELRLGDLGPEERVNTAFRARVEDAGGDKRKRTAAGRWAWKQEKEFDRRARHAGAVENGKVGKSEEEIRLLYLKKRHRLVQLRRKYGVDFKE